MKSRARKKPLKIVMENGEPSAVLLDIEEYKGMLERLEDAEDHQNPGDMRKKPLKFKKLEEFRKNTLRILHNV